MGRLRPGRYRVGLPTKLVRRATGALARNDKAPAPMEGLLCTPKSSPKKRCRLHETRTDGGGRETTKAPAVPIDRRRRWTVPNNAIQRFSRHPVRQIRANLRVLGRVLPPNLIPYRLSLARANALIPNIGSLVLFQLSFISPNSIVPNRVQAAKRWNCCAFTRREDISPSALLSSYTA